MYKLLQSIQHKTFFMLLVSSYTPNVVIKIISFHKTCFILKNGNFQQVMNTTCELRLVIFLRATIFLGRGVLEGDRKMSLLSCSLM